MKLKSKAPELLIELGDHTAEVLIKEYGIDESIATAIAQSVVDHMRTLWGGNMLYFPKGHTLDLSNRDHQLFEEFTGRNHDELVKKYGLTLQGVYKIIRRVRKIMVAKIQTDMFCDHDD